MADKRIIEQVTSEEILNDDWLIKDSVTEGTTKVQPSTLKEYVNIGMATAQALLSETQERESNDETLSGRITAETEVRTNAVNSLSNRITSEATARENADSTIRRLLGDETTARTSGDNELSGRITSEVTARTNADLTLDNRITNEVNARELADTSLSNRIDSEASTRNTADTTLANNFADEYDASTSYEVGNLCTKDLVLYKCTTATTGTWDDTKWEEITVEEVLDKANKVDDVQTYGGNTLVTNKIADLSALTIKNSIPSTPTAIATFADGAEMVMPSLKVAIEPQQDLHGYDSPWVGGAGKNKLPMTVDGIKALNTNGTWSGNTYTLNNVTFTIQTDASNNVIGFNVNSSSTASATATFFLVRNDATLANELNGQSVIINGSPSDASTTNYGIQGYRVINGNTHTYNDATFTFNADASNYFFAIYVIGGQSISNKVFKPMLRLATVSDATFAPYSNICPISGWDEANVGVAGKNLLDIHIDKDTPNTTITLAQPINQPITISAVDNNITVNDDVWRITITLKDGTVVRIGEQGFWGGTFPKTINGSDANPIVSITYRGEKITSGSYDVQVELGTTPTTYEPYNGHTYIIELDGTRYGGELDVVNGMARFVATKGYIASYNGETLPSDWISDRDVYSEGATPTIGAEVVYTLATPTIIPLGNYPISSLEGVNNVFADSGEILEGEYIADASTVIAGLDARITALENA